MAKKKPTVADIRANKGTYQYTMMRVENWEELAAAEAAENAVTSSLAEPSGHVRVSCLVPIAREQLTFALPLFLERYPRVSVDLVMTNRRVNLLEDGIDIAIRVRTPEEEDPNLATRRLRHTEAYLVASPALMKKFASPEHPRSLTKFPFLGAISQDRRAHFPGAGSPAGHQQ